jgi:DNA primase large subunit
MADLLFCARYPFTQEAKDYVSKQGLELTSGTIEKAESRVKDALSSGKIKKIADLPEAREEELILYAAARMIVSSANNRYLINRYAVAEAKRASDYLSSDLTAHPSYVEAVAAEFGIKFEKAGTQFLVSLSSYLSFTPRSIDYKLTNREVAAGKVKVSGHERVRILEEAVKKRIEGSLPIRAEFPTEVKAAGARIIALLPKFEAEIIRVGQENYPPCVKKLLEDLALNINVPHTGRVSLAIYLVNAGVPDAKIVEYFRLAPDFSEKTTRYQVDHIRKHKYRMSSCSTMDSYGICIAECRCGSPLNFRDALHGRRLRQLEEQKKP